uniref:Olfactomedin-like domain-containing protein n=1 Tax=Rhabditophanes sp. KR3021 TaxID=114890 RepID=A0AC35TWX7_9BILA
MNVTDNSTDKVMTLLCEADNDDGKAEERNLLDGKCISRPKPTPIYIWKGKQIKSYRCGMTLLICVSFAIIVLNLFGFRYYKFGSETGSHAKNPDLTETPKPVKSIFIPPTFGHTEIMDYDFRNPTKLSYDAFSKQIFISFYNVNAKRLQFKTHEHGNSFVIDNHNSHKINHNETFDDCMQYADKFYCCQLNFKTRCFDEIEDGVVVNSTIQSDSLPEIYQRVNKDEAVLFAYDDPNRSFLDINTNKIKTIDKCCKESTKSSGFYFPDNSTQKVNELIIENGFYKLCDYQLSESNKDRYERTQNECIDTTISQKSEFPHSKFCSSHNFVAVVIYAQIGDKIKWELYWKIWPTTFRYIYTSRETSLHGTIFLSCEERNILFYASTNTTVYLYPVGIGSW